MATNREHPSLSSAVTEELLVTVAEKLYAQHLQEFASTLVGLDAAEYNEILKEAGDDAGKQCIAVSFYSWFIFKST